MSRRVLCASSKKLAESISSHLTHLELPRDQVIKFILYCVHTKILIYELSVWDLQQKEQMHGYFRVVAWVLHNGCMDTSIMEYPHCGVASEWYAGVVTRHCGSPWSYGATPKLLHPGRSLTIQVLCFTYNQSFCSVAVHVDVYSIHSNCEALKRL